MKIVVLVVPLRVDIREYFFDNLFACLIERKELLNQFSTNEKVNEIFNSIIKNKELFIRGFYINDIKEMKDEKIFSVSVIFNLNKKKILLGI